MLCTPDCGQTGEHAYWMHLLVGMTPGRTALHNGPNYVPEDSQGTMPALKLSSFLSIVDGSLNSVPLSDPGPEVLKELMAEN